MNTQELTQEQIRVIGLEVLARELGATGLIRFLQIYEQGSGDYTRDRTDILPPQTAAQIAEKIRENRDQ
ncbi:MAG: hypothetical protein M3R15_22805 [Acidobacteriota bacterium]|nr:hypothetical protein [Acidobacteriota bacterium]